MTQVLELDEAELSLNSPVPWYIRLWASVFRRAVVDWVLYRNHENVKLKKLGVNAENWIFKDACIIDLGSFDSLCTAMGISPELMREKILGMTEDQARRLRGMEFGDEW